MSSLFVSHLVFEKIQQLIPHQVLLILSLMLLLLKLILISIKQINFTDIRTAIQTDIPEHCDM